MNERNEQIPVIDPKPAFLPDPIKLMMTIVDRGKGEEAASLFRKFGVTFTMIAPSRGAAGSDIVDFLGLSSVDRDIVLSVARSESIPTIFEAVQNRFHFDRPGTGLIATLSIAGVSGPKVLGYISGTKLEQTPAQTFDQTIEEEPLMPNSREYDLIVTVVNRGFADQVIDAAKEGGAGGGTIFYARGSGIHEVEKFFSVSIQPEREVILSLVRHAQTQQVMHAIIAAAGLMTEGKGLAFSLPVDEVMGVAHEKE